MPRAAEPPDAQRRDPLLPAIGLEKHRLPARSTSWFAMDDLWLQPPGVHRGVSDPHTPRQSISDESKAEQWLPPGTAVTLLYLQQLRAMAVPRVP